MNCPHCQDSSKITIVAQFPYCVGCGTFVEQLTDDTEFYNAYSPGQTLRMALIVIVLIGGLLLVASMK